MSKGSIDRLQDKQFPMKDGTSFIVTLANPFTTVPTGYVAFCLEAMTNSDTVTVVDSALLAGSDSYPNEMLAGQVTYGNFSSVAVGSGYVKVYLAKLDPNENF